MSFGEVGEYGVTGEGGHTSAPVMERMVGMVESAGTRGMGGLTVRAPMLMDARRGGKKVGASWKRSKRFTGVERRRVSDEPRADEESGVRR